MFASAVVYVGLAIAFAGLIFCVKPIRRPRMPTRLRGLTMAAVGVVVLGIGFTLPARESRISRVETRLDEFAPAWQFREFHSIRIVVPPARVFDAIKRVRADEIFLFRTLIWIRAGGQPPPESIRAAAARGESLIDLAMSTTFVRLAEDVPRELVVGTVVGFPPGGYPKPTPEIFLKPLPPGFVWPR